MSLEVELSPEIEQFQARTKAAFIQLVNDKQYEDLWQRFRFTYEVRRQLPYLSESGQLSSTEPNGLTNALASAFYEFDTPSQDWLSERNRQQGMQTPINDQFRTELLGALDEVVTYSPTPVGFHRFVAVLQRRREQLESLTEERVRSMLEHGLNVYWELTRARGYSGDPW